MNSDLEIGDMEFPAGTRLEGQETILVVEDQMEVRKVVCESLEVFGYSVLEAPGPEQAWFLSERHRGIIHLLLADVLMPKVSGPELAKRLRTSRPDMKILFMSGWAKQLESELAGAIIEKPFTPWHLAAKVRETLGPPENTWAARSSP